MSFGAYLGREPPIKAMDVASLYPLPVGIVRWDSAAGPAVTVVVKLTLAIGEERVTLAEDQEPLSIDRLSEYGDDDDLYYPTDFVPRKARADLLLVGSARAPVPAATIPIRIRLSDFDKSAYALCAEPSSWIPLSAAYLRASESSDSMPVMVGPRAATSPERAAIAGGVPMSAGGPPAAPLVEDFDFGFFNAAPPDQQVDSLRLHAALLLEGLLPDAPRRELKLPDVRPRIYCRGLLGAPAMMEVRLRCDTLWIDVDRGICTQTWRGALPSAGEALAPAGLVVTLSPHGSTDPWTSIEQQLGDATIVRAVEAADLLVTLSAGDIEDAEAARRAKRQEMPAAAGVLRLGGARIGAARLIEREPPPADEEIAVEEPILDEPTAPAPADEPADEPAEPTPRTRFPDDAATGAIDVAHLIESTGLPFQTPAEATDWRDESPVVEAKPSLIPDLPFIAAPISERRTPPPPASTDMSALPFHPPAEATDWRDEGPVVEAKPSLIPDLPFIEAPAQERRSSPPSIPDMSVLPFRPAAPSAGMEPAPPEPVPAPVPAPVLGGGFAMLGRAGPTPPPPPDAAEPRRTAARLPLERYAAIRVALWAGEAPLEELLQRNDIDELAWRENEKLQAAAVAAEAREGRCELALALAGALWAAKKARRSD